MLDAIMSSDTPDVRATAARWIMAITIAFAFAGCSTGRPCPKPDLGGWLVGYAEPANYGIHHYCTADSEQFVLEAVVLRRPDGSVNEWRRLAELQIGLERGESTMFGFECGSRVGARGDAIAVVRHDRTGRFHVQRAWIVDTENLAFVAVLPSSVFCESLE